MLDQPSFVRPAWWSELSHLSVLADSVREVLGLHEVLDSFKHLLVAQKEEASMARQSRDPATEVSRRATDYFLIRQVDRTDMQFVQIVHDLAAFFILVEEAEVDLTITCVHLVRLIAIANGHEEHFPAKGRH